MQHLMDHPLPLWSLLLLLCAATAIDLLKRRIPNLLCTTVALAGLLLQSLYLGSSGIWLGLGGALVGLISLLPLYLLRGMGAGDVKLMSAIGTFLGPLTTLVCVALTLICGALLGLSILLVRGGLSRAWQRYSISLQTFARTLKLVYLPPTSGETAAMRFPYALAISVGTLLALIWQAPLGLSFHLPRLLSEVAQPWLVIAGAGL